MKERDNEMAKGDALLRGGLRSMISERGPICLEFSDWLMLAENLSPSETEREKLQHAGECDRCAALLNEAAKLAAPLTDAEQAEVARLPSSLPQAVAELVPERRRTPFRYSWLAVAAALFMIVAGAALYPHWQEQRVHSEIVQAFMAARPYEFRISGVPYGPYEQQRSWERARTIPKVAESGPWSWRAALLGRDPDTALEKLERTARTQGVTADLANDRGALRAARGDELRSEQEYLTALSLLDDALSLEPEHRAALFNKAVVLHRLRRREAMRAVLTRFLNVEMDKNWRVEAEALLMAP